MRLRVDGGFKTGRDVIVAAMLGADMFGFGTSFLIALGWIFLVVAILRRRRWAMDHPMVMPALSDTEHGASGNA